MQVEQHVIWDLLDHEQRKKLSTLDANHYERVIEAIRSDVESGISYEDSIKEVIGE